jgi:hypothetical protein
MASQNGHEACVQLLIERVCNVDIADKNGCTALMLATAHNRDKCVRLLIKAGADVEARGPDGRTSLEYAKATGVSAAVIHQLSRVCAQCGKHGRKMCSGCHSVHYCSDACINAYTKHTKDECATLAAVPRCQTCKTTASEDAKLLTCSRCKQTRYCSAACQRADWPRHKSLGCSAAASAK